MQEQIRFVELKDSTGIFKYLHTLCSGYNYFFLNMNRLPSQDLLNVFQTSAVNTRI